MKAIRIDSDNGKVELIDIDGGLQAIYKALGCTTIDGIKPSFLIGEDIMYIDDEGLLNQPHLFFEIADYGQPIAGNGLILGTDAEGNSIDCLTPLELARSVVKFMFTIEPLDL